MVYDIHFVVLEEERSRLIHLHNICEFPRTELRPTELHEKIQLPDKESMYLLPAC